MSNGDLKGAPLDGHINRVLSNKRIVRVEKNPAAQRITFAMDNGERWNVAWVSPNGTPLPGEPALVYNPYVQGQLALLQGAVPVDGHINAILAGKTLEMATKTGIMLVLHLAEGGEVPVCWVNEGRPVAGEPCLINVDAVVMAPAAM